jgi:hypothetical protein
MVRQAFVRESPPTPGRGHQGLHRDLGLWRRNASSNGEPVKKADVIEHPEVFDHVGLLFNKPSSDAGMLFV